MSLPLLLPSELEDPLLLRTFSSSFFLVLRRLSEDLEGSSSDLIRLPFLSSILSLSLYRRLSLGTKALLVIKFSEVANNNNPQVNVLL